MVTLVGSVVWSANAGVGESTPEINVTMLKQDMNKRLKTTLLAFIYMSPHKLVCDGAKRNVVVLFY
jgi:hypothetical protein